MHKKLLALMALAAGALAAPAAVTAAPVPSSPPDDDSNTSAVTGVHTWAPSPALPLHVADCDERAGHVASFPCGVAAAAAGRRQTLRAWLNGVLTRLASAGSTVRGHRALPVVLRTATGTEVIARTSYAPC